jgi:hypothetical protein
MRRVAAAFAVAALFLGFRIAAIDARTPFFDELFTRWLVSLPLSGMARALVHDSGPPLYYFLVHALLPAGAAVRSIRLVSLVCAAALAAVCLMADGGRGSAGPESTEPPIGVTAAALLAVFPPAVFAAADARAYALAALFVGVACVSFNSWVNAVRAGHPRGGAFLAAGCAALLIASAAHYYGVLFFAVPAILGAAQRNRRALLAGIGGSLACGAAYAPGFWLAARQPAEAIRWMGDAAGPLAPLTNLGFAAGYPASLMPPAPIALTLVAMAAFALAVWRTPRSQRAIRFGLMTAIPVAVAMAASLWGRRVYFPLRFEAMIAPPLVLWISAALGSWAPTVRRLLIAAMMSIGAASCLLAVVGYAAAAPDAYRAAAAFVRNNVDPRLTIVTSGYSYLETISQRDSRWHPRVIGLPPEQAIHPGWYERRPDAELRRDAGELLAAFPEFLWVGQRGAPELGALRSQAAIRPLWSNGLAVVARVTRR